MSTSDVMNHAQRRMAEHAFDLKKMYNQTFGMSKKQFMTLYDEGEIQLSSVFENLLVAARNHFKLPTRKVSAEGYDFVKIIGKKEKPLGDMKTVTLQKDGKYRRFMVRNVADKQGYIYVVGYNWITDSFNYFAIPPKVDKPKTFMVLGIDRDTGEVLQNKYGKYAVDSFEKLAKIG